jgi:hypothetical protein
MNRKDIEDILFGLGVLIVLFLLFFLYGKCSGTQPKPTTNTNVQSLTEKNDSIKIVINNLDSIKNAKVIEVSTLDDDSTIKLFYELVRE